MGRHPTHANVTCACRWRLCGINLIITIFLVQCFLKYNVMGTCNYTFPSHRSHIFLIEAYTAVIIRLSSHAHIMKRAAIIFTRFSTTSFIAQSKWSFHLSQSLNLFVLQYTYAQCATVLQRLPFQALNTVLLGYKHVVNVGRAWYFLCISSAVTFSSFLTQIIHHVSFMCATPKNDSRCWNLWQISVQIQILTLILLTWRIWWAPNNANKWQMGLNSAFKGLIPIHNAVYEKRNPLLVHTPCKDSSLRDTCRQTPNRVSRVLSGSEKQLKRETGLK